MSIVVSTAPTSYPVTLDEFKSHARITDSGDDDYLNMLIGAATAHTERDLNRKLITQTITWKLDYGFPAEFCIPVGPLSSVSSITYLDGNGDSQTLASDQYVVDASQDPGRIYPAYSVTWPSTRLIENAVTVVYVAGYGAASAVPIEIRQAVLLLAAHLHEHREAYLNTNFGMVEVPLGYASLLHPYRVWSF